MKKVIIILFLFCLIFVFGNENITLKYQAVIDLCNFLNLEECIIDCLYLTLDGYWHIGEYSKIFPVLYLITQINPNDVNAFALGGWFLINGIACKYDETKKEEIEKFAIEFIKKGIEKNPQDYTLYWELSWFYFNRNKFDIALEFLEKAERCNHPFLVENLKAHIYLKLKDYEKAIKELEKIIEKYPERKETVEQLLKKLKEKNE